MEGCFTPHFHMRIFNHTYIYMHHVCFKHMTFMHKKQESMNDRFSHNFHYQITGWKVCDVKKATKLHG